MFKGKEGLDPECPIDIEILAEIRENRILTALARFYTVIQTVVTFSYMLEPVFLSRWVLKLFIFINKSSVIVLNRIISCAFQLKRLFYTSIQKIKFFSGFFRV